MLEAIPAEEVIQAHNGMIHSRSRVSTVAICFAEKRNWFFMGRRARMDAGISTENCKTSDRYLMFCPSFLKAAGGASQNRNYAISAPAVSAYAW